MGRVSHEQGFTLMELLVVGGVLVLLTTVAAFMLRPASYAAERRNAERWQGLAQIAQGLTRYQQDAGTLDNIPTKPTAIGSEGDAVDICAILVPKYLAEIPLDPSSGGEYADGDCSSNGAVYVTGYAIMKRTDGAVMLVAPAAEGGAIISLTVKR